MSRMQKSIFVTLFIVAAGAVTAQQKTTISASQFNSLAWLEGTWERTNVKPGTSSQEKWEAVDANHLKGLGVLMRGTDTIFVEKLSIVVKDETIYYVADIKENKEPVFFKFTALSANGFTCENPQDDFPKKIEYQITGNQLKAVVSGDGKTQNFVFAKK